GLGCPGRANAKPALSECGQILGDCVMFGTLNGDAGEARAFKFLIAGLVIALAVGLTLASLTYGTNDILFFKSYAVKASSSGVADLYREGAPLVEFHPEWNEQMAHPPGVIHIWRATFRVEQHTG